MLINHNGKDVKLPDFLIVGAAKSGTTSLHYYLKQHPQIFMPNVKELRFFSLMDTSPDSTHDWLKGSDGIFSIDKYLSYFKDAKDVQVIGESCPIYLYTYKDTIRNIKKVYGESHGSLKIILILRNPAEMAWSHFMMRRKNGAEPLEDFREYLKPDVVNRRLNNHRCSEVDYIGFGMYYEQVKSFMDEFADIKIFTYDDLCADGLEVTRAIFRFLEVDDGFIPEMETKYNVSGNVSSKLLGYLIIKKYLLKDFLKLIVPRGIRRKMRLKLETKIVDRKHIPDDIRQELIERYYKEDICKLGNLIGRELSTWLKI